MCFGISFFFSTLNLRLDTFPLFSTLFFNIELLARATFLQKFRRRYFNNPHLVKLLGMNTFFSR